MGRDESALPRLTSQSTAPIMLTQADREANKGRIIMGVDDAPEDLLYLRTVLSAAGYSFVGVASGYECLQMVTRVQPRLILLDVEMKEVDGFETCRRLRQIRELRGVPIAFLTASNTGFDVKTGIGAGGDDFLTKPFDHARLLERAKHWIARGARVK